MFPTAAHSSKPHRQRNLIVSAVIIINSPSHPTPVPCPTLGHQPYSGRIEALKSLQYALNIRNRTSGLLVSVDTFLKSFFPKPSILTVNWICFGFDWIRYHITHCSDYLILAD
uniref:Uncharacterized protein n=1 Tax=Caenorhabditis japonica TaxID=281687 RepID=A0A8R1EFL2_CAEJA